MKPVDKSKRSNRRCCNCGHYADWPVEKCLLRCVEKHYWNCCKNFIWREDKQYLEVHLHQHHKG